MSHGAPRRTPVTMAALTLLLVAGCGDEEPSRYVPVADVQELMITVVEPAADAYWDAVGWIIDEGGTTAIRPETPEDWEAVRNAAYTVAESGNLLMMDARAWDEGPWIDHSRTMVEAGRRAIAAAESRDPDAVFDAGAELYQSCTACHAQYATRTLRPSARIDTTDAPAE